MWKGLWGTGKKSGKEFTTEDTEFTEKGATQEGGALRSDSGQASPAPT